MAKEFKPGDKVKLTASFLRSTGQYIGGEGNKRWIVLAVESPNRDKSPVMVTVDEKRADLSYWTAEELKEDPSLVYRRILSCNLMLASKPG